MELSISDENHSLTLCVYVTGFGKSGHIIMLWLDLSYKLSTCSKVGQLFLKLADPFGNSLTHFKLTTLSILKLAA